MDKTPKIMKNCAPKHLSSSHMNLISSPSKRLKESQVYKKTAKESLEVIFDKKINTSLLS